jgi:small subunit ribosomal protein S20
MKRHRQSEERRLANRAKKSTIRTFTKKAVAAAETGDCAAAAKYQKVVQGLVDRAI